jgi:hypothetical protein
LREDEMPSGDEEREVPSTEAGEEEASEASSRESLGAARLPFWVVCENVICDILSLSLWIENYKSSQERQAGDSIAGSVYLLKQ